MINFYLDVDFHGTSQSELPTTCFRPTKGLYLSRPHSNIHEHFKSYLCKRTVSYYTLKSFEILKHLRQLNERQLY